MKEIDELLELSRKRGAAIPPPASAEDLKQCSKDLAAKGFPRIPQRYFAFLRTKCNGFDHGITFYGTKPFHTNGSGLVQDLVTANEQSGHSDYMKHGLLIGRGWDYKYFYNTKNGLYETRDMLNYVQEEHATFKELFCWEWLNRR